MSHTNIDSNYTRGRVKWIDLRSFFLVLCSKNYIIRQFYFMMSVVLYNLWVLINLLLSIFVCGKIPKKLSVTAKLFGTVLCTIIDPGGGHFESRD